MNIKLTRAGLLFFLAFLFTTSSVYSQYTEKPLDYRKFSVIFSGGASLGDMNNGNFFLSSNFSVDTRTTPAFGAALQYSITPAWSLEWGYRRTNVEGISQPFTSTVHLLAMKNIVNLNELLSVNQVSSRINPFLSLGIGYDLFEYKGQDANYDKQSTSFDLGAGVAYRLTNTLDLLGHYEYHLGTNNIDNQVGGYGNDIINMVSAGIRINLGKKSARLTSWREVPVEVTPSDYSRLKQQSTELEQLQERMERMKTEAERRELDLANQLEEKSAEADNLRDQLAGMDTQMKQLKNVITGLKEQNEGRVAISSIVPDSETNPLPKGHYVQLFASRQLTNSQVLRDGAMQVLRDVLGQDSENLVIIERKGYYEVFVGVFDDIEEANSVQQVMAGFQSDSYVITFPRPLSLLSDFEGMRIVEQEPEESKISVNIN